MQFNNVYVSDIIEQIKKKHQNKEFQQTPRTHQLQKITQQKIIFAQALKNDNPVIYKDKIQLALLQKKSYRQLEQPQKIIQSSDQQQLTKHNSSIAHLEIQKFKNSLSKQTVTQENEFHYKNVVKIKNSHEKNKSDVPKISSIIQFDSSKFNFKDIQYLPIHKNNYSADISHNQNKYSNCNYDFEQINQIESVYESQEFQKNKEKDSIDMFYNTYNQIQTSTNNSQNIYQNKHSQINFTPSNYHSIISDCKTNEDKVSIKILAQCEQALDEEDDLNDLQQSKQTNSSNQNCNKIINLMPSSEENLIKSVKKMNLFDFIIQKHYNQKKQLYKKSSVNSCESYIEQKITTEQISPTKQKSSYSQAKYGLHSIKILQNIGSGTHSQVYLAIDKTNGFLFAIKKIKKEDLISEQMEEQFSNEIKIQNECNHPNIVKLYGYFCDSTYFYLIMEYIHGIQLRKLLEQQQINRFQEPEASYYLYQISNALRYIHDRNIIHRDVKAENILIINGGIVKMVDFGYSRYCSIQKTRNTFCGTLDYLSPEIIRGQSYNGLVDVWAFGVLAYQLLQGVVPFYEISQDETLKKIQTGKFDFYEQISRDAQRFVKQLLQINQENRLNINEIVKNPWLINQMQLYEDGMKKEEIEERLFQ